jgi:hypothetical protein
MRLSSAHMIALLALVLAAGGGLAVAQQATPAGGPHAYKLEDPRPWLLRAGRPGHQQPVDRLVVPAKSGYVVTAKLNIAAGPVPGVAAGNANFAGGTIVCNLVGVGSPDTSRLTLSPDDAREIWLTSVGVPTPRAAGNRPITVTCGSTRGDVVVSGVRITALTLSSYSGSA